MAEIHRRARAMSRYRSKKYLRSEEKKIARFIEERTQHYINVQVGLGKACRDQ